MRFPVILSFVASILPGLASAQAVLVPAAGSEPGAMSVGCPSDWEHREAGVGSFSCRDSETGAYCSLHAPTPDDPVARTLDDAVVMARRWFSAGAITILSERREARAHVFVLDRAGQRSVVVLVPQRTGVAQVMCGAGSADVDALLPTFVAVAISARR